MLCYTTTGPQWCYCDGATAHNSYLGVCCYHFYCLSCWPGLLLFKIKFNNLVVIISSNSSAELNEIYVVIRAIPAIWSGLFLDEIFGILRSFCLYFIYPARFVMFIKTHFVAINIFHSLPLYFQSGRFLLLKHQIRIRPRGLIDLYWMHFDAMTHRLLA